VSPFVRGEPDERALLVVRQVEEDRELLSELGVDVLVTNENRGSRSIAHQINPLPRFSTTDVLTRGGKTIFVTTALDREIG
jgi:hypothetical protein